MLSWDEWMEARSVLAQGYSIREVVLPADTAQTCAYHDPARNGSSLPAGVG
jgi:hypothetical protein